MTVTMVFNHSPDLVSHVLNPGVSIIIYLSALLLCLLRLEGGRNSQDSRG